MVDLPIIDTHVHLWDPTRFRMAWVDGNALFNRPYSLQIYHEQTRRLPIKGMVFIECGVEPHYAYLEAQWAVVQAREDQRLQGIVAAAPIEFGLRTRTYLEALVALDPRIKGVRRNLQNEEDLQFFLSPDFVRGVQLLSEYHLSFDICVRHWQLSGINELVRRCPDTLFILDHLGKPNVKEHLLDPWRDHLRALAALPNVVCKISGMVTEADHTMWKLDDLAPYLSHVLEVFGEDRVAFGGDWPVVLEASEYTRWIETLSAFTASLPESAQRKFWSENARRFYRLQKA
ncbi:MAG: amidohydrolase family protein [Ktedonobacteraceae bacterium]